MSNEYPQNPNAAYWMGWEAATNEYENPLEPPADWPEWAKEEWVEGFNQGSADE